MNAGEVYIKRVEELLDGIDKGEFSNVSAIPGRYTYGHLTALFYLADQLKDGKKLYEHLYDRIVECGKRNIQKKLASGQKIKIAFLAISAAEWAVENIYRMLSEDKRLECYVVVCPLLDRDREVRRKTEEQTYHFFRNNQYDVRRIYRSQQDGCAKWEEIGGLPDVVVHLTTWYQSLPEQFRIEKFPLHIVNCYVPYGMYVADSSDGNYVRQMVYNKEFVNLQWRVYTDSEKNLSGYAEYGLLHGKNVRYSGYPKMDYFQEDKKYTEDEIRNIWKIPDDISAKEMKKLIIAPHHSLEESMGLQFSTFIYNAFFWLYLAQKYRDRITFIFKPHPNLRLKSVWAHFFKSFDEYDAYIEVWESLPNARVSEEESYLDIFATSDGMIMDSGSFLGEYLYVNKPMLFLTRKEQAFNSLGKKLISAYDTAEGNDYIAIEQFVERVILQGDDAMEEKRSQIFKEELDYIGRNGCTASEFICRDIFKLFE